MDNEISKTNNIFELSFTEIFRLLLFYKWWILIVTFLCILFSLYITWSTVPVYVASSELLIEKKTKAKTILQFSEDDTRGISNELKIIKSRLLADEVIKELWNSKYRNNLYLFNTRIFYPKGQRIRQTIKKIISFGYWQHELKSPEKFNIDFSTDITNKFSNKLRKNLKASSARNSKSIKISYNSPNPKESALIANTIARVYQRLDKEWTNNESEALVQFLNKQISNKGSELEKIELRLRDYKKENKIFSLNANSTILFSQSVEIERELKDKIALMNINNSQIQNTKKILTAEEKVLANNLTNSLNSTLEALRTEISTLDAELVKNASVYGESHEAVKLLSDKKDELKNKLISKTSEFLNQGLLSVDPIEYRQTLISKLVTIEMDNKYLDAQISELQNLLNFYHDRLVKLPEIQREYGIIERENIVLSETYKFMRKKLEEAKISKASEAGKVRIIDEATPPKNPIKPDLLRNLLMSMFSGFFISSICAYVIELSDKTVKNIEYVERFSIPILAIIPAIGQVEKIKL